MNAYAGIQEGRIKAENCAGCHGLNGISLSPEIPNLAGQKQLYLMSQLKAFHAQTRKNPTMNAMAEGLSHEDMTDLATYYSSLERQPVKAIKAASSSGTATSKEFPETTWITMKKSGAVERFPNQMIWKGGSNMLYDAVTPDGKLILATSPTDNTVYVFDAKTGRKLAVVTVGDAPKGVKVSPDGKVAYIANQKSANISVLDIKTLKITATIPVKTGPHNCRFTKDGSLAYVTLQGGAGLGVIDTKAQKMIRVIPISGIQGPHNLDLSADTKIAYVRDIVKHVAVVNLRTGKTEKVMNVGHGHAGLDVTPNGRYVVTGAIADTYVSIIDTQSFKVHHIEVGNGPHGVRASNDGRWIYVAVSKDNVIAVINTLTMKVEKKIAVGKFPFWIAVQGNP
ncbi:MAG: beta-propeller fold lactonase family protein [Mariprofundaceae bacterium]|nr:beta-propeller fold lactonase family protein [Mariprofundaceae bacterium]